MLLRVMVRGVWVVVDGRMRLGRHVMAVVLPVVLLPASIVLVHGAGGRTMTAVAGHHGREMLPLQPIASQKDPATNV